MTDGDESVDLMGRHLQTDSNEAADTDGNHIDEKLLNEIHKRVSKLQQVESSGFRVIKMKSTRNFTEHKRLLAKLREVNCLHRRHSVVHHRIQRQQQQQLLEDGLDSQQVRLHKMLGIPEHFDRIAIATGVFAF
jgi:hypothetical protein